MAITVTSSAPQALLAAILKAIKDGHVDTWQFKDGYFTHSPSQWRGKAWLKPSIANGTLALNIVHSQDQNVSTEAYAVYHGRFIEMLLAHFDKMFDSARSSAMPAPGDAVQ